MSINNPLISAIVSTYNSEKFIRGKIEDLLNQTIAGSLEIIIVNSGSPQNEDKIIKEYLIGHPNIKYIHTKERETIYKAWNRGIKEAKGKYITNANTDDRLKSNAYEVLAQSLDSDPETALVYANQYISNIPNQRFDEIKKHKSWNIPNYDYMVQLDRCVVLSQPMWRASLHFEEGIWFDDNLEICGDHKFELDIQEKHRIKFLPEYLGLFYVDKKKSNVSLRNMTKMVSEKNMMTSIYIKKHINKLTEKELLEIKNRFDSFVKLPIEVLRGRNIILKMVKPWQHQYTHEFVYYFLALIYLKLGNFYLASQICSKLLKTKKSTRVSELLTEIINLKSLNV